MPAALSPELPLWPDVAVRAAWLVARWRIRHRWAGLLALGLMAGVVGGLATGAIAGERRTATAAERLIEATGAADAWVMVRPPQGDTGAVVADVERQLGRSPEVDAFEPLIQSIGRTTEARDWYFPFATPTGWAGELDRPVVADGRLPRADAADEVALTVATADSTGLGVGDTISMDVYTQAQMWDIRDATEEDPAGSHLRLRVVGVVRDARDVAKAPSDRIMLASAAFHRARHAGDPVEGDNRYPGFAVRTRGPESTERLLDALYRTNEPGTVVVRSQAEMLQAAHPAQRALSIGCWVLAAVVIGVGGFVVAQAVRRHLGSAAEQERCLRAVGFTRGDGVAAAAMPGATSAVVAAAVSVAVAVAVSPAFPLGQPRLLEPTPGTAVDLLVVPLGALVTVVVTVAVFAAMSWLDLRTRRRTRRVEPSRSLAALATVLPPSALLGLHLGSGPTRDTRGLSPRTAVAGTALGLAGLVAASTFALSLRHLEQTPASFGQDYDLAMEVPDDQVGERLGEVSRRQDLSAVAEQRDALVTVDGEQTTGVSMRSTRGSIEPVVVSGRLPSGPDEVALGADVLRRTGATIGGEVRVGSGGDTREATVVGIVLDPRITSESVSDVAFLRSDALADLYEKASEPPYPMIVVRYAPGTDHAAVTAALDREYEWGVMDESTPNAPGPLQNLIDVGAVPQVLVVFFAGLTVVSLANGIVVAGRRGRRDIGVVRGLGFTGAQVRTATLVMAASLAAAALLVGVPIGLVVGSTTWSQVASGVDLVPVVSWPIVLCLVLVPALLALAALVSAWPARAANAHHPADILRAE